ncbi:hypothetical protein ARMGADRAFT_1018098, partial [Armillaria gallica]
MVSRARSSYSTKVPSVDGSRHSLFKQYLPVNLSQHPAVHRRTGGDQERATRLGNVGDEASRKWLSGTFHHLHRRSHPTLVHARDLCRSMSSARIDIPTTH